VGGAWLYEEHAAQPFVDPEVEVAAVEDSNHSMDIHIPVDEVGRADMEGNAEEKEGPSRVYVAEIAAEEVPTSACLAEETVLVVDAGEEPNRSEVDNAQESRAQN